jgi:hypothetical protein
VQFEYKRSKLKGYSEAEGAQQHSSVHNVPPNAETGLLITLAPILVFLDGSPLPVADGPVVVIVVVGAVKALLLPSHIRHAVGSENDVPASVCVSSASAVKLISGILTPAWALSPISILADGTTCVRLGNTVERKPVTVLEPSTGSHWEMGTYRSMATVG